jgi:two-component system sensor histidine kinase YesM
LFTSLSLETELRKTAEFKQLQAQINPHFLYNSLFFIMSKARTSPDSVEQMSKHLAEYYRYNTRLDSREVTFGSELKLAEHYLIIMSLCKELAYEIKLPEELETLPIIPLIIQPIVENAIQHGIEERQGAHRVSIEVLQHSDELQILIHDDGKGLNDQDMQKLLAKIASDQAPAESRGIGLWNVNQRLKNEYGQASGLSFSRNDWGGLTVTVHMHLTQSED